MRIHRIVALAVVAASVASVCVPAFGDLIQLSDGRVLSGTAARKGDVLVIQEEGGGVVTVRPGDVVRTTLTSHITLDQAANAEWTRDAALIKQAGDLPTIVGLHEAFLAKYGSQKIGETVRGSLAEYQKLVAQNGVKFRGRWMPAAQVEVTLRQWVERAEPALKLYQAGQLREALDAAKGVADLDHGNPNALTIAGLASYRLNDTLGAEGYFTELEAADPANVLAENNLAVVLFASKRQVEALAHYTLALQAMPGNRLVADNIEEALHAYAGNTDGEVYRSLLRQFQQAESRLEAVMAGKAQFRWGSTWVSQRQLDRLNANLQAIKVAMARLDMQYQAQQQDSGTIADQVKQATDDYNNTLNSIQYLNSMILNGGGDSATVARRDAMMTDLDRLRQQKAALEAKQANMVTGTGVFAQAAKLKAALADAVKSQYTGVQRIMDIGEADDPPAPTVVAMPAPLVVPMMVQQAPLPNNPAPPAPMPAYNNPYQQVYNNGNGALIPPYSAPGSGEHGRHGRGGANGNGGTPVAPVTGPSSPTGPAAPTGPTGPGSPIAPVQPVAPVSPVQGPMNSGER